MRCGTQVGLLKVYAPSGEELFNKGLDTDICAPIAESQRLAIFAALGISPNRSGELAGELMSGYSNLPRSASIAVLGVVASSSAPNQEQILDFLCNILETPADEDGERRLIRQAGLALAVAEPVTPRVVSRVARFFATVNNRWLEYPLLEFFNLHQPYIASLPVIARDGIRKQIEQAPSFYAPLILKTL